MRHPVFAIVLLSLATASGAESLRLSLGQAEALLARNRDILAAQRAVESARAGATVAGQAPNPTLTYSNANISTALGIGKGSLFDKRFDQFLALSQLIERGAKREWRSGSAEALLRAATADLADVRRQQRLMLHQAYYDVLAGQEKRRLLADMAAIYDRLLDTSVLRLKAGDVAAVDTGRLRVEALRARNDERAAQAELAQARQTLAYMIGETARADELVADAAWPDTGEADAAATAVERRPDVRAARERVEAARQGRELARSLATRDVTVGAQLGRTLGYSSYMPGVNYGVTVSVPLFLRYTYEGEIAQAETAYTAAIEAGETVTIQAKQEVARARTDLAAARERWQRTRGESLPEAHRVAEAAEFAYRKGAMSLTDLLDARRTLRSLELEAVATRADHAKARAAWLAATEWETAAP
jgi:cobalt-zinc-cadmium efflux system outer membrane protein